MHLHSARDPAPSGSSYRREKKASGRIFFRYDCVVTKSGSGQTANSYAIEPDETLDRAMRRIIGEQFARLIGELARFSDTPAESAHNARRRIKETRALLRLFRPFLIDYTAANGLQRDVARKLAGVRDADAMRQTLLRNRGSIIESQGRLTYASVRRQLARARTRRGGEPVPDESVVAAAINDLQLSLATLLQAAQVPEAFASIAPSLGKTYRAGREWMTAAASERTEFAFHEWRKHVKTLWYHMQLLRNVAPDLTKPYRDLLNQLAKALGEHHDIHVLSTFVGASRSRKRAAVQEVLSSRLAELEERALLLGAQIYAEKSGAFVDRIESLWAAFRPASLVSATEETSP